MTDIKWGPAIAVDGKRPGFVGDTDMVLGHEKDGSPFSRPYPARHIYWTEQTNIALPADHPHYRQTEAAGETYIDCVRNMKKPARFMDLMAAIPEGMKAWHGGDSAPADWDGKEVRVRNGTMVDPKGARDAFTWQHTTRDDMRRMPEFDIVAYTPVAAPIDWSGELEAVHEDGRVVPVKLENTDFFGDRRISPVLDEQCAWFVPNGTGWLAGNKWRIRNVPQPTVQADTKPDLTARVRDLAERIADSWSLEPGQRLGNEARAIADELAKCQTFPFDVPRAPCMAISEVREMVAKGVDAVIAMMLERGYALPEPVDEDLFEARKLAADWAASFSHEWEKPIRDGEKDADPHSGVSLARAALARGRALALAGEKEA